MITTEPGFAWKTDDVVTPARLNRAITDMKMKAGHNTLLGVGNPPEDPESVPGESEQQPGAASGEVVEIPVSKQALAFLAAETPADAMKFMLDLVYPVGAWYVNFKSADLPAHIAALGTWVKLNGVFIGAADTRASGADADFAPAVSVSEKTVKLTKANLPAEKINVPEVTLAMDAVPDHTHPITGAIPAGNGNQEAGPSSEPRALAQSSRDINYIGKLNSTTASAGGHTPTGKVPQHQTDALGSGEAVKILPPRRMAHMWERTA